MGDDNAELERLQSPCKAEVEAWIAAIRTEEALASVDHTVAQVDKWEEAHFLAEDARSRVEAAKAAYEAALRAPTDLSREPAGYRNLPVGAGVEAVPHGFQRACAALDTGRRQ